NWVAFLNRRLKEDLAMPQQLAACKTVQDMYGVYAEFFQNACSQYQSEFEQLTKLSKSLADDTMQVIQSRMEEAREARARNWRSAARDRGAARHRHYRASKAA